MEFRELLLGLVIRAFAAGLVLATTERREHIEERSRPVADLLVPVFFVTVGVKVQPRALNALGEHATPGIAVVLCVVAVASKLMAGLGVYSGACVDGRSPSAWSREARSA